MANGIPHVNKEKCKVCWWSYGRLKKPYHMLSCRTHLFFSPHPYYIRIPFPRYSISFGLCAAFTQSASTSSIGAEKGRAGRLPAWLWAFSVSRNRIRTYSSALLSRPRPVSSAGFSRLLVGVRHHVEGDRQRHPRRLQGQESRCYVPRIKLPLARDTRLNQAVQLGYNCPPRDGQGRTPKDTPLSLESDSQWTITEDLGVAEAAEVAEEADPRELQQDQDRGAGGGKTTVTSWQNR